MFTVYVWADGETFDPERFQSGLAKDLTGMVRRRKRVRDGVVEEFQSYWKSEEITTSDDPEGALIALLARYRAEISRAKASGAVRIFAEIVAEFGSIDELRGFYFTPDNFALFAELGVALDIDLVRRLD